MSARRFRPHGRLLLDDICWSVFRRPGLRWVDAFDEEVIYPAVDRALRSQKYGPLTLARLSLATQDPKFGEHAKRWIGDGLMATDYLRMVATVIIVLRLQELLGNSSLYEPLRSAEWVFLGRFRCDPGPSIAEEDMLELDADPKVVDLWGHIRGGEVFVRGAGGWDWSRTSDQPLAGIEREAFRRLALELKRRASAA